MAKRTLYGRKGFWIAASLIAVLILCWFGIRLTLRAMVLANLPPPVSLYSEPERVRSLFWAAMDAVEPDSWWAVFYPPSIANAMTAPTFNARGLRRLERRFGDMPEFWQMRYLVSQAQAEQAQFGRMVKSMKKGEEPSYEEWEQVQGDIAFLEKAVEAAPDDASSLFLLAQERYRREWGEAGREEKMMQSLRRCIELAPEQATYHYELARYLELFGEQKAVLAELAAGNAASKNDFIDFFPFSYIRRNHEAIDMRAGGLDYLHLYGWMTAELSGDIPPYIRVKDFAKEVVLAFNVSGDATMLTTFHRYAARLGSQRGASTLQILVACVLERILLKGAIGARLFTTESSTETVEAMSRLQREVGRARGMAEALFSFQGSLEFQDMLGEPGKIERYWPPAWSYRWFRNWWKSWEAEMSFLEERVSKTFAEIEKFDYTNPVAFAED